MSGGSFSTPHFCLLCNTGLEHLRSPSPTNTKGQSQGLAVVPLSSSVSGGSSDENETTCERMKEEDSALSQSNKNDQDEQELCEADWIKKYQVFLSKALHINLEKYMKDGMELLNTGTGGEIKYFHSIKFFFHIFGLNLCFQKMRLLKMWQCFV